MMTGDEIDRRRRAAAVLAAQPVQQLDKQGITVRHAGKPDRQHSGSVAALGRLAAQLKGAVGPIGKPVLMQVEDGRMHLETL